MGELTRVLKEDLVLTRRLKNVTAALEQGLLISTTITCRSSIAQDGVPLRDDPTPASGRCEAPLVQSDYEPLWEHYREKNFQVRDPGVRRKGLENSAMRSPTWRPISAGPRRASSEYFANRREIRTSRP